MGKSNEEISKLSKQQLIKNRKMRSSVRKYLEELNKIDPRFLPFDYTAKKNKEIAEDLIIYHTDSSDLKDILDKYKTRKRTYSTMLRGYSSDSSGGKKQRKTRKNIKGGSAPKQFEVAEIGETGGSSDKASSLINAEIQQLGATQAENSQYEKNMPTDNESYNLGKVIGGGKKKQKNKKKHKNTQKKQKK